MPKGHKMVASVYTVILHICFAHLLPYSGIQTEFSLTAHLCFLNVTIKCGWGFAPHMTAFPGYIPGRFVSKLLTALRFSAVVRCLPPKCVYLFRHRILIQSTKHHDLATINVYCYALKGHFNWRLLGCVPVFIQHLIIFVRNAPFYGYTDLHPVEPFIGHNNA